MAKKQAEAGASAPDVELSVMTVEVLHPITYLDSEYGRGLHRLPPDVAEFFLSIRVPNRVLGPQPVARIPVQAGEPKMGVVKPLVIED